MSDYHQLQKVFAQLNELSIVTLVTKTEDSQLVRQQLTERLQELWPAGSASYLFADKESETVFSDDGKLIKPLTLYSSGAEVNETALALLARHGLAGQVENNEVIIIATDSDLSDQK